MSPSDLTTKSSEVAALYSALARFLLPIEAQALALDGKLSRVESALLLGISDDEVDEHVASAREKLGRLSLDDLQWLVESGVTHVPDSTTTSTLPDLTARLTPELFRDYWIPKHPRASDDLDLYGLGRPTTPAKALTGVFIEKGVNTRTWRIDNLIVIDLDFDQPEWLLKTLVDEEEALPEPSFTVINRGSGHAHVGWFIKDSVSTDAARAYFYAVQEKLTLRLRGDRSYHGTTFRNPLHWRHRTVWGTAHRYTLDELHGFVADIVPVNTSRVIREQMDEAEAFGRNVTLFTLLRHWAYRNRRHYTLEAEWIEATTARVFAFSDELYPGNSLPAGELARIALSVGRWVWERTQFSAEGFSALQSWRSQQRLVVKESRSKFVAMILMQEAGLSYREIADQLGYASIDVAKKAMRDAKDWRSNSPQEFLAIAS